MHREGSIDPAIRIEGLRFRYREGEFELAVSELRVEAGERVAVIGPSGSGKTTLLHLVAGIVRPEEGTIHTRGVEVTRLGDGASRAFRLRQVGLVFQEFELLEYLSVLDNILLPFRIDASLRVTHEARDRARKLAGEVGIEAGLGRRPDQLSHGERQRVAICRALVMEPSLVLADEPTGNLDPANKGRVLSILFDYTARTGATLVTVTHDHDLLGHFDRVVDFKTLQRWAA